MVSSIPEGISSNTKAVSQLQETVFSGRPRNSFVHKAHPSMSIICLSPRHHPFLSLPLSHTIQCTIYIKQHRIYQPAPPTSLMDQHHTNCATQSTSKSVSARAHPQTTSAEEQFNPEFAQFKPPVLVCKIP